METTIVVTIDRFVFLGFRLIQFRMIVLKIKLIKTDNEIQ